MADRGVNRKNATKSKKSKANHLVDFGVRGWNSSFGIQGLSATSAPIIFEHGGTPALNEPSSLEYLTKNTPVAQTSQSSDCSSSSWASASESGSEYAPGTETHAEEETYEELGTPTEEEIDHIFEPLDDVQYPDNGTDHRSDSSLRAIAAQAVASTSSHSQRTNLATSEPFGKPYHGLAPAAEGQLDTGKPAMLPQQNLPLHLFNLSPITPQPNSRPSLNAQMPPRNFPWEIVPSTPQGNSRPSVNPEVSPTNYPWMYQARAQAGMNGGQVQAGVVNSPSAPAKSRKEMQQIKRHLDDLTYPMTLDDVPELTARYNPQQVANPDFFDPENPEDICVFTQGEDDWNVEKPPAVLGMLDPPPERANLLKKAVATLRGANGRELRHKATGFPIRNLPYLPRFLSSDVSELVVEVMMRKDPRVTYSDLRSRQPCWMEKQTSNEINALNNRRNRRVRQPLNVRCWSGKYGDRPTKTLVELLDSLTQEQIDCNTTWVVTPNGIHPPNNPNHTLPKSAFKSPKHKMSEETVRGLEQLGKLRARASELGVKHFSNLARKDLPSTWSMRQQGKRKRKETDDDDEEVFDTKETKSETLEGTADVALKFAPDACTDDDDNANEEEEAIAVDSRPKKRTRRTK